MRRLIAIPVYFLLATAAFGQEPATGIPPFSSVQSVGIDSINRQNLNVNFSIPIVSSPGRGINFSFPITNDSLFWMKKNNTWTPVVNGAGTPTWGWKTATPAGTIRFSNFNEACDSPPPIQYSHHYSNYSYVDPTGASAASFKTSSRARLLRHCAMLLRTKWLRVLKILVEYQVADIAGDPIKID